MLVASVVLCGCTKTYVRKVARYNLGDAPTSEIVPRTGIYAVKYTSEAAGKSHKIDASERLMVKGERLGFATDEKGRIVGLAGDQRIKIYDLPDDARSVVWYHKSNEQTQFGREMEKASKAGRALAVGTAVIGGALLIDSALPHDEDADLPDYVKRQK
jgi:hypothetical protein